LNKIFELYQHLSNAKSVPEKPPPSARSRRLTGRLMSVGSLSRVVCGRLGEERRVVEGDDI